MMSQAPSSPAIIKGPQSTRIGPIRSRHYACYTDDETGDVVQRLRIWLIAGLRPCQLSSSSGTGTTPSPRALAGSTPNHKRTENTLLRSAIVTPQHAKDKASLSLSSAVPPSFLTPGSRGAGHERLRFNFQCRLTCSKINS